MEIKANQKHHFESQGIYSDDEGGHYATCIEIGMSDEDIETFCDMIKTWIRQAKFNIYIHDSDPKPWMIEKVMRRLNNECELEDVLAMDNNNDVETVKDVISELCDGC